MLSKEYICLKTKPFENFPTDSPIVHNPEERFYVQSLADHSILIGGFLRQSKPIFGDGVPDNFHFSLLPDNWDDFRMFESFLFLCFYSNLFLCEIDWILSNALKRFPILAESEYETLITGADSFTPDGRMIMNESAEVRLFVFCFQNRFRQMNFIQIDNYFVATGANGHGIALAGGIGKYMAELVHTGNTDLSTWSVDIRRFMRLHANKRFLQDRLQEIPGRNHILIRTREMIHVV